MERHGDWILPRHYRALSVMGNLEVDLTRARLGAGTSQIEIVCIMGAVTVLVPPDIRLDCDAIPVVGNLEVQRNAESTTSPDAPLVQVIGTAFMGSIEVKVVDPNAPGWAKRLRARWARATAVRP
ncbi:MAG: cell wall-active antibiotics response protein [Gemmatimonadota bacterium]|nr:cell wall-active antibiotics response protein [Gemmatimonadota bacterium]